MSSYDDFYTERSKKYVNVLEKAQISQADFDKFYSTEYRKLGFDGAVRVLTIALNPTSFAGVDLEEYADDKKQCMLLAAYVKDGGDLEYFTAGAGAPGNCVIS